MKQNGETLMDKKEAAKKLGCTVANVNWLMTEGKLNPVRILGRVFFSAEELSRHESTKRPYARKTEAA